MENQGQLTLTLHQLAKHSIVTQEGNPATLYQIAYYMLGDRIDLAIESAQAGDFSKNDKLNSEIKELVDNFVQHGLFIIEEIAIIKDPDGPEAKRRIELRECAKCQYRANLAESRKQKKLSKGEKTTKSS